MNIEQNSSIESTISEPLSLLLPDDNIENDDMTPPPLPPPLARCCTDGFRQASCTERQITEDNIACYREQAIALMESEGISYHDAMSQLDKNWSENQWTALEIKEGDLKPGDIIYSEKPPILCCNSLLKDGLYNDTVLQMGQDAVTYRHRNNGMATHSGDVSTPYGLRHTVTFNSNVQCCHSISTPWLNSRPMPISTLVTTEPVFEVRTFIDNIMTRQVIGQDYSIGEKNTACVNARVTKMSDILWKIEIMTHFLESGFADDIPSLVRGVELIPLLVEPLIEPLIEPLVEPLVEPLSEPPAESSVDELEIFIQ